MKILRFKFFDDPEEEVFEINEPLHFDENTKCLTFPQLDEDMHPVVYSIPVENLRMFTITDLERRL